MRIAVAFLLLAAAALGQTGVPRFTREGLPHGEDGKPLLLAPGMIVTVYGADLGPDPWCEQPIPQNGPYPLEACGVRVLVDGRAAGLLFAGSRQINFKIPDDAPEDGSAPIQVCVHDACSDRMEVRFSLRKAFIHLQGHAYVHMPVWIEVEQPQCCGIQYPYNMFPLDFGDARFEVFHNGELLKPVSTGTSLMMGRTMPQDTPRSRLPLHLMYRFDEPGVYSVRFAGRGYTYPGAIEMAVQSDWTDIVLEPYSDAQRYAWLASEALKARSATPGELVGDIIPSLLAWRDEAALSVLLTLVDNPNALVRQFARMSLDLFDEDLQRRVIPASRWDEIHIRQITIG
jgi:hypothetical protein